VQSVEPVELAFPRLKLFSFWFLQEATLISPSQKN
jgi:hypothetical protein